MVHTPDLPPSLLNNPPVHPINVKSLLDFVYRRKQQRAAVVCAACGKLHCFRSIVYEGRGKENSLYCFGIMSDSFADLWSSSAPLPPKPSQQTLSSISSNTSHRSSASPAVSQGSRSKPDVFSLLASSGSNTSGPRYGGLGGGTSGYGNGSASNSSTNASRNASSRPITPAMPSLGGRTNSSTPAPAAAPSTRSTSGDAFSDLFSSASGTNGSTNASNMTLAARLAMEAKSSQSNGRGSPSGSMNQPQHSAGVADSAWAGLDSLASGGGGLGLGISPTPASTVRGTSSSTSRVNVNDEDDWGLGDFGAPTKVQPTTTTSSSRSSRPAAPERTQSSSSTSNGKKPTTLWDLDDFASPQPANTRPSSSLLDVDQTRPISRTGSSQSGGQKSLDAFEDDAYKVASPDADFDFGNREDDYPASARSQGRSGAGRGLLDSDDEGDMFGRAQNPNRPSGVATAHTDEDDILGMLSQPVEAVKAKTTSRPARDDLSWPDASSQNLDRPSSNSRAPPPKTRSSSPPPHILGQIVEMGFSVKQAKDALLATSNGQDVQAALESLLNGGSSSRPTPPPASRPPAPSPPSSNEPAAPPRPEELQKAKKNRQANARSAGENSSTVQASVAEIQEQADKLLAQASEIGLSVFSKASAFWKEGKEKVVKAYEERSGEAGAGSRSESRGAGSGRGAAAGGRPKWMQEVIHQSDEEDGGAAKGGFTDDLDDAHHDDPRTRHQPTQQRQPPQRERQRETQVQAEAVEVEIDLFSSEPVPQRAATNSSQASSRTAGTRQQPPSRAAPPPSRTTAQAPPAPVPTRSLITASPSALALAQRHKTEGTEKFKLGQHAAAADSYSASISALPRGHLLLVPLHTNRALARLKTGEYAGAVEDCQRALEGVFGKEVFGSNTNGSAEQDIGLDPLAPKKPSGSSPAPPFLDASVIPPNLISAGKSRSNDGGWTHPQGIGVDLLDAYIKALRRAAEAFEGREKWADAVVWWSVLSRAGEGAGSAWVDEKSRKEAVSGGVRCRKMIDGGGGSSTSSGPSTSSSGPTAASRPAVKPRPKPRPAAPISTEPSKALQALQTSNAQAEADDAAKHALKDTVDARIGAWKNGKETNIRALLGSLENVLWEGPTGVGGLKMGMADLVSAAQVKKNYMKAIARVHPDKLNAGNSTIEQRMLANAIFGALNEAWIAFQATQK
ncbi:hypothetical protein D9613_013024 [Agrocybe pediades]|uniref:UBA domain-containing protein n=1 Tax=Agrocybe pediades TaxID=84607 RepID=A0A8H4VRS6_9AGAR|nr:hypothetical protein D9613_013024 [Agrocybe pediades]